MASFWLDRASPGAHARAPVGSEQAITSTGSQGNADHGSSSTACWRWHLCECKRLGHHESAPAIFLIVLDGISFHELVEARYFEPELAGRAAERATEDDLNAIQTTLRSMEREVNADLAQHDTAFHEAIFRAAGNRVCEFMLAPLHRVILDSMRRAPNLRPPTVSNARTSRDLRSDRGSQSGTGVSTHDGAS